MLGNSTKRQCVIASILVMLATMLVYSPILRNDFISWDDDLYIYANQSIKRLDWHLFTWAFTTFHAYNYHPLTWLSHAVDFQIWAENPAGHHFVNIFLHGCNALAVFWLCLQLLSLSPWGRNGSLRSGIGTKTVNQGAFTAALVTALFFGLHPTHVEPVAWASERKELLCTFFFLLSVSCYLYYASAQRRPGFYVLCFFTFVLALLSKPMAITLPLLLLLFDLYPLGRFGTYASMKKNMLLIAEKIPFFVCSAAISVLTVKAHALLITNQEILPGHRILVAFKALFFYLKILLVPSGLSPVYPYPKLISLSDPDYFIPVFVCIALFCILFATRRRQHVVSVCFASALIMLLPVLGLIQAGNQFAADRYLYLPGIPIFFLIGLLVARFWEYAESSSAAVKVKAIIAVSLVCMLAIWTYGSIRQMSVWRDTVTVFSRVLREYPDHFDSYLVRAAQYIKKKQFADAVRDLSIAVELRPKNAAVYSSRGKAYAGAGQNELALKDFKKAIALNPNDIISYSGMGDLYLGLGKYREAVAAYDKAVELNYLAWKCMTPMGIDPKEAYASEIIKRGRAYGLAKNYHKSLLDLNKVLELFPDHQEGLSERDAVYRSFMQDTEEQLRNKPGDWTVYLNRGIINSLIKNDKEATKAFDAALELKPDSPAIFYNRGIYLFNLQRHDEAARDFSMVVRMNPNDNEAYFWLAESIRNGGDSDKARQYYEQAAKLGNDKAKGYLESIANTIQGQ